MTHLEKLHRAANEAAAKRERALLTLELAEAEYRAAHYAVLVCEAARERREHERLRPKSQREKQLEEAMSR